MALKNLSEYVGVEYADHGRGPKLDCWGLVLLVHQRERGVELPDYAALYDRAEDDPKVERAFENRATGPYERVLLAARRELDILVFNVAGRARHCGLVLEGGKFLHIHRGTGSCIESLETSRWKHRLEGVYRPTV